MNGKFCDGDCNGCEAIRNRQLTVILNALYKLFGDTVYKVVQKFCPNMTCCADCGIDDFCHCEDCELEAAAGKAAADMPKASKKLRDEGETSSPDKAEHVLDVLVGMKRFAAYTRKQNASDEAAGESSIAASMSNAMADLIDSYVNRLERAYTYDIWLMGANKERKFDNG